MFAFIRRVFARVFNPKPTDRLVSLTIGGADPLAIAAVFIPDSFPSIYPTHEGGHFSFRVPGSTTGGADILITAPGYKSYRDRLRIDGVDVPIPVGDAELDAVNLELAHKPLPSREQVRNWNGCIALTPDYFSPFYFSWSDGKRAQFRQEFRSRGLTHVIVMLACTYNPYQSFDYWHDLPLVRERLHELIDDDLIPVLWAGPTNDPIVEGMFNRWRDVLPQIKDLIPAAVTMPEMNDTLTPIEQHEGTKLLAELLPDAYILVHFRPGRPHGDNNRSTGPAGPPPPAWNAEGDPNGDWHTTLPNYYNASPFIHALFYNLQFDDLNKNIEDLKDVSIRVNGIPIPGEHAPYPGMGRDVVCGEFGAYDVIHGHKTYEDNQAIRDAARQIPGITGVGD